METPIKVSYSGSESLQMMKQFFPTDWQDKVETGMHLIIRLKKLYKKPHYSAAYRHYIASGCRAESGIMMMAALHLLIQQEKDLSAEYQQTTNGIVAELEQLEKQVLYLNDNKIISDEDKKILWSYYTSKHDELSKRLIKHSETIEVVDAFDVEVPNLFTQGK